MVAGAPGSIIGQSIELFDHHDRCQPRRPVGLLLVLAPVLLLGAVALSACAWDPPTIERTPREAAGSEPSAKSRLAARKGTVQSGTAASGAGEKIDVPGDMAALEVDLTNFKERLIGLDSDEINDLMGTPSLERAEPPALIWQYRHQICTVDIFMFDDGGGSAVDHVEVRPTSGTNVNDKECFTALLRNVPQAGAGRAKAGPPIAAAPSTAVGRRATPSAAPPSGPAQTPSSSRPPVPSTAAPSAAPTAPPRPAAAAPAVPEGEEGPPPTDTDIDFDFGAANAAAPAAPGAFSSAVQNRAPSPAAAAAPAAASASSEAMPIVPDEFSDAIVGASSGAKPAPGPSGSAAAAAGDDDADFADPLDSAPPKAPPPTVATKPSTEKPAAPTVTAKPAPAPLAPAPAPAAPVVAPAAVTPTVAAVPPPPPPPAAPATAPAPLSPRVATATAQAQPKGAVKGAAKGAAVAVDDIEDEDLPPGAAGLRADDPSRNNQDMVE